VDRTINQVSGVARALFIISAATGFGLTAALGNRVPFYAGLLVGLYLLFSIKVADQWEKVAAIPHEGLRRAVPECSVGFGCW